MDKIIGNLASNTARQIYSQVSGLNIYDNGDAGLQLNIGGRGLDPNRSSNFNTRQNGYDISADVLGYPESYYTPIPEALQEVQIIRGAASLQHGTQFGGLVNFVMKKAPFNKPFSLETRQTIGSFGFYSSFNRISARSKKLDFTGFINYKRSNGYRENSDFHATNTYFDLGYKISKKTEIRSQYTYLNYLAHQAGGLTDEMFYENAQQSNRVRNWFDVNWNLYSLKIKHKFNDIQKLQIDIFGLNATRKAIGFRGNPLDFNSNPITTLDEQDSDEIYIHPRDYIKGEFKNWGTEIRQLNEFKIFSIPILGLIGFKYYHANNSAIQGPSSNGTEADFSFLVSEYPDYPNQSIFTFPNRNIAAFSEFILDLTPKLSITPGIRYEWIKTVSEGLYQNVLFDNAGNAISNEQLLENRKLTRGFFLTGVGLSFNFTNQIEAYANISQNYRSVTFNDIRVVSPTFVIDPEIKDETGYSTDLGIRGKVNKTVSYDLNLFTLHYNNRIGIRLDERANRERTNIGKALILGIESNIDLNIIELLNKQEHNYLFHVFLNFAWTHSEYKDADLESIIGNRVEFIPLINLKTGFQLGYKNFILSSQLSYLSKQFTDVANSNTPAFGANNSGIIGEIPYYNVIDLSVRYKLKAFQISTGINNLTNKDYFTRRALGYPGPGILPADGRSFYLTLGYTL